MCHCFIAICYDVHTSIRIHKTFNLNSTTPSPTTCEITSHSLWCLCCAFFNSIFLLHSLINNIWYHTVVLRYLKRGISIHGKVANDCEVEQIIQLDSGVAAQYCSYLQMRGSIPTYWYAIRDIFQWLYCSECCVIVCTYQCVEKKLLWRTINNQNKWKCIQEFEFESWCNIDNGWYWEIVNASLIKCIR